MREDLHAMQQVVNKGEYSYWAPRTREGHSDRCTALALAVRAAGESAAGAIRNPKLIHFGRPAPSRFGQFQPMRLGIMKPAFQESARTEKTVTRFARTGSTPLTRLPRCACRPARCAQVLRPQAFNRGWMMPYVAAYDAASWLNPSCAGRWPGSHVQQWELFRLMLDTWPALAACKEELLYGITRRELQFDPYAEEDEKPTPNAIEREKLVTEALRNMQPQAEAR